MNTALLTDASIQQRHAALDDAISHCRRASSAVSAAAAGDCDELRFAVLEAVQQRLCSLLVQLKALS
jgi:hypothetical protein